ncbi:MAG: ribosome maturation factor RimM [Gammaproteobacteria bacterium]|nr:ribosome maturation factor RimM [Gammaproteobacteria bacterium]MBU2677274.1 ribosome maturation factor RimM [Gammaproteobacteria bacterium]NNC56007.1 ribosome maturation factor RimM [Woeseiaceae bacterium]NNL51005.1 ribosome maturation factor RimM [Woeseiaceae bacterium]
MVAEPIVLGRISGVFGVKGWVRVFSYTDPREALLDYDSWLLGQEGEWRSAKVAEGQRHGKAVVARIDGYDDRDKAATLIGTEIGVPRDELPETEDGHYYWSDLEGMKVVQSDGAELGQLAYMLETGAHDVMVIKGEEERLVPFVKDEVVLDVDLAAGVITVDWEWD